MNFDFIPEKAGKYTVLIDIDSREIQVTHFQITRRSFLLGYQNRCHLRSPRINFLNLPALQAQLTILLYARSDTELFPDL